MGITAISRAAASNLLHEKCIANGHPRECPCDDYRALMALPSVTPKQSGWIPVSEGLLPKEGKTVIASTKDGVYPEAKYTKEYGWLWAYEAGVDYWVELENVTAWMPLPTKYEPQESENEE